MSALLENFDLRNEDYPSMSILDFDVPVFDLEARIAEHCREADNAQRAIRTRDIYQLINGPFADRNGLYPERFALLNAFPELEAVIKRMPGRVVRAQISMLGAGQKVRMHKDGWTPNGGERPGLPFFVQTLRLHVPVLTSDRNFIFVDGALAHVRPGQLFYFNNLLTHAAFNLDDGLDRSHLIMDIQPDAELRDLVLGGQAPEPVAPAVYEALDLARPEAI